MRLVQRSMSFQAEAVEEAVADSESSVRGPMEGRTCAVPCAIGAHRMQVGSGSCLGKILGRSRTQICLAVRTGSPGDHYLSGSALVKEF